MSRNRLIFLAIKLFMLSGVCCGYSQNGIIDSLTSVVKFEKEDIRKVKHLNALAWQYLRLGNSDSTIEIANRAERLSINLGTPNRTDIANSYGYLGMGYSDKGDFATSLTFFLKALKIGEELSNQRIISSNLANIGNVYGIMGELDKSIGYFLKALKIAEETGDERSVASTLSNLGILYDTKKDYKKALEFYFKALEINKKLDDKAGIGSAHGNIGLVFDNLGEKEKALTYYFQALSVAEQHGNKKGIAIWLGNIGHLYAEMIENASPDDKKALGAKAESCLLRSLAIDTTIGFLPHKESTHQELSELYAALGDYKKSVEHYKEYSLAKDLLFNEEKKKEITRHEMNYEFEKKAASLKAEQDKKQAVVEADKKRQNIFFWLISFVTLAISVIVLIIARSLKITRRQKQIIEEQKEIVEEKQREVMDSIHYARRIQQSLLPTEKYIEKNLQRLKKP